MIETGFFYLVLITLLYVIGFRKDADKACLSLITARQTLVRMAPLLLSIFALIGLFNECVPPSLIRQWLGSDNQLLALLNGGNRRAVLPEPLTSDNSVCHSYRSAG
jgi:uncharacterized membrane protein YraQ (UPF0718 family)